MTSNMAKCELVLKYARYARIRKGSRRTLCSDHTKKCVENPDVTKETSNQPDDFIELNIPPPKYEDVNVQRNFIDIFKDDFKQTLKYIKNPRQETFRKPFIPYHYDVAIFGAGPIGSTLAHMLKQRLGDSMGVIVIDGDLSPDRFSKVDEPFIIAPQLTVGHLTQQFSLKENILLARRSIEYFRNLDVHFSIFSNDVPLVSFRPFGQLNLATNKGHVMLKENHMQQSKYGVFTELATAYQLSQKFPWLNVDDISLGCIGTANEGCIDPWEYLLAVRSAAIRRGAVFLESVPLEFHFRDIGAQAPGYDPGTYQSPHSVVLKEPDGKLREIDFAVAVIALGSETGKFMNDFFYVNKNNNRLFKLEVPISRKKHYVFCFESEKPGPGLSSPMVNDPSGVYFRRDGFTNQYVCGCTLPIEDPTSDVLKVDSEIFYNYIWPILAYRVPAFEKLQLKSGWAYFEDHNQFDGSPLIGYHPAFSNIMLAAGFGRHSVLYAPGVAKALEEHICESYYSTIDLTRFGYNRIAQDEPLVEPLII